MSLASQIKTAVVRGAEAAGGPSSCLAPSEQRLAQHLRLTAESQDASWWLLPGPVREVAEVIGSARALRLAGGIFASRKGTRTGRFGTIYVPEKPKGNSFNRIAQLVGEDGAAELVARLGGTELRFGSCATWANRVRDASIRDYWEKSRLSAAWIGWLHDITERRVRQICRGEPRRFAVEGRWASRTCLHRKDDV